MADDSDIEVEERTLRYAYQPGWEAREYNRLRDLIAELAGEGYLEFVIAAVADGFEDAGEADYASDLEALMESDDG